MTMPDISAVLGHHEAERLSGPEMTRLITQISAGAPELGRFLLRDGFGAMGASAAVGYREWALLTCAILIALGDAGDQLEVYAGAALDHGATGDEMLDIIDLACLYAGAPRAVNAARRLSPLLAEKGDVEPVGTEAALRLDDHETGLRDNGGAGVPMLLLHALSMDHRFWRKIYPALARHGRVIAYDLRGHGRARAAPLTRSLDHVASDAVAVMDRLGVERADVYGASYGGAVAQHLALNAPGRVRSLALIATAARSPLAELEERAVDAEQHGMEAQVSKSVMRWFLPETIAANPWEVRYARNCVRRARIEDWASAWRAMARLDVAERAGKVDVPVLALSGKQDLSATPDVMEACAKAYKRGQLRSIDPGTHMMPMEQPEAVAAELVAFRERVSRE